MRTWVTKVTTTSLTFALLLGAVFSRAATAGEIVDKIVATVNGRIVLQSDWDEALSYEALMNGRLVSQFTDDERRLVLDRLIDQELLREQMKSTDFQHCTDAEAVTKVSDARKQYPEASSDPGWQSILSRFHFSEKDFLTHVRRQIDVMRLVDARLRPTVQIDAKTVEAYYRDKFMPQLKQAGGNDVPLADVAAKIRELLTEQKVSELLVSWLQTLRSESEVRMPGSGPSADGVQSR